MSHHPTDDVRLSFHGADRAVTGSCHLLDVPGHRILVDCGMYQGEHDLARDNAAPFGFDPASIDWVLLTHAHLDHCGRLPLLYKRGFRGEIIATGATRELARLVMLDAAHLHEEEAGRRSRRSARRGGKPVEALYTALDALNTLDTFGRVAEYEAPLRLAEGLTVTYRDAGHILGSAMIEVELHHPHRRRLLFSGDLGGPGHPILRDPAMPTPVDDVVMESTYGDRDHRALKESVEELYGAVGDTIARGGNVLIPSFALERTQELLYFLRRGIEQDRLPRSLPVFLDSPMAISATEVFRRHPECYDAEAAVLFANGGDPFRLPGLQLTRTPEQSMALNRFRGGAVIIAGSGMCTGGRIRHHLRHNLWRASCGVIFVGFAAPRTLARAIVDGAREVHIFGEAVQVRARVYTINGFSAHAGRTALLAWHEHTGRARTFLVHGDPDRGMNSLAAALKSRGVAVTCPEPGSSVVLS